MPIYTKAAAVCLAFTYSAFTAKKHLINPINAALEEEALNYEEMDRRMEEYEHMQSDEVQKMDEQIDRLIGLRAINARLIPY